MSVRQDWFTDQLVAAALQARAAESAAGSGPGLAPALTAAELRVLQLLLRRLVVRAAQHRDR